MSAKQRAKKGLGSLGRWAAGGGLTAKAPEEVEEEAKAEMLGMHREGVIWYLQQKLQVAMGLQREMMEVRISREVEKSKSVLYMVRGVVSEAEKGDGRGFGGSGEVGGTVAGRVAVEEERKGREREGAVDYQLTEEQMQLFAQENQDMLKQYEDSLDQVRYVALISVSIVYACLLRSF